MDKKKDTGSTNGLKKAIVSTFVLVAQMTANIVFQKTEHIAINK